MPKLPKIPLFEPKEKPLGGDLKKKKKKQNKLLPNRFGHWFRKKSPICAKNVPKRPKVLVLDSPLIFSTPVGQLERKTRKKKIKLPLKWFANSFRKNMCWKCAKSAWNVTFWTKTKVTQKAGNINICPPVGQIDHKNGKNMDKLLSNWFGKSFRKKPPRMRYKCAKTA